MPVLSSWGSTHNKATRLNTGEHVHPVMLVDQYGGHFTPFTSGLDARGALTWRENS